MIRPVSIALALVVIAGSAHAQFNPIPESRVPGFGDQNTRPGSLGGSPASSGSGIGTNVGAGASASPIPDPVTAPNIAEAPAPTKPLIGLSREIPVR